MQIISTGKNYLACLKASALIMIMLVLTAPAYSQSVGGAFKGLGNNDDPIQIEADNLEIIDNQNTALLTGNVSVVQGSTIFQASRIKVFYLRGAEANNSKSGIRRIEASGKVAVRADDNKASADKAIIDMVAETVVLSGNVIMSQGKNVATGCQVTVNLRTSVSNIKSCGSSTGKKTGRPVLVFDPKSRKQ